MHRTIQDLGLLVLTYGKITLNNTQPPHTIRTTVEQMEGDREGNYRVSKKEAELAYDGGIGPYQQQ